MGKWPITRPPEGDNCQKGCDAGGQVVVWISQSTQGAGLLHGWPLLDMQTFFSVLQPRRTSSDPILTDRQAGVVDERERTARARFEKR